MLVTARPGAVLSILKNFTSVFINVGYDAKRRSEFVLRFAREIASDSCQPLFEELINRFQFDSVLNDLCRNPLNLSILCMLIAESKATLPSSKTSLYQELQRFILQRASNSLKMDAETLEQLTNPLSEVAFTSLLDNCTQIEEKDLAKVCNPSLVQNMGILRKDVSISKFSQRSTFSFTHKSFQDFYAAKRIMQNGLHRMQRRNLAAELLQLHGSRFTLVFVCGLLAQSQKPEHENTLLDVFELLKRDTFLPCVPCEQLGAYDAAENHRGHLLLHCLNELSHIASVLGLSLVFSSVEQVCLSYPWCSSQCIEGFLKFSDLFDTYCMTCSKLQPSLGAIQKRLRKSLDELDLPVDVDVTVDPKCRKFSLTIPAQMVSERFKAVDTLLRKVSFLSRYLDFM